MDKKQWSEIFFVAVGAMATAVYTYFTIQLVEVTKEYTKATKEYTEITRTSFEATNPTATLLERTLPAQGFMGTSKAAFPYRLRPQTRDSTWANLVNALK